MKPLAMFILHIRCSNELARERRSAPPDDDGDDSVFPGSPELPGRVSVVGVAEGSTTAEVHLAPLEHGELIRPKDIDVGVRQQCVLYSAQYYS